MARSYYQVLDFVHRTLYPRTYLEVGIYQGYALNLALPGTRAVGVDPNPRITSPLPSDAIIEQTTSDELFQSERLLSHLGGAPLDLSFIDGMHLWEYSLRDFLNVERFSATESIVLIHDCLPRSADMAGREEVPGWWTGDVWKLLYFMREELPDLHVTIVDAAATGLGVIQNLNSTRPPVDVDGVIERYMGLDFRVFVEDLRPTLRIVPSDEASVRSILPEMPWQPTLDVEELLARRARRRPTARARLSAAAFRGRHSPPARVALRARRRLLDLRGARVAPPT